MNTEWINHNWRANSAALDSRYRRGWHQFQDDTIQLAVAHADYLQSTGFFLFFFFYIWFYLCVYPCASVHVLPSVFRYTWKLEDGVRYTRHGDIIGSGNTNMDCGNQLQSYARAASVRNHWVISPASGTGFNPYKQDMWFVLKLHSVKSLKAPKVLVTFTSSVEVEHTR